MADRPSRGAAAALRAGALAALVAALLASCKESSSPPAPANPGAGAPTASAAAAAPEVSSGKAEEDGIARAKALALAKPGGSSDLDREIELYQKRAQSLPRKVDTWILLGRAWVRKARESADPGFYLNADACAEVVLDMQTGDPLALNLRSLVLINDHKFAEARDLAGQVLAKDPDNVMALGNLSDALLELGRFDEATAAAQKMMDLKPNLPSYSRASYLRWLKGDIEGAKSTIRQAYDARDPKDPEPGAWVLVQAALIFFHLGDYSGADKGFDLALRAVPDYPPALAGKGRVALAQDDYARASALLAKAYSKSPLVETAWLLGDAKEAAGDLAGAKEAYALVVKTGRQSDPRTLALFYATKNRDHDEALRLAEEELKVRGDIYTHDAHAWALYRAGKLAEARAAAEKAIALGTPDARLLYHAGAIKIAAGDKAAGEKLVREALKKNPKFDRTGAAEAKELIEGGASKATPKAASSG